ncbi:hypothetical protein PG996_009727 [Apiospora saccharicola]|uniref:Protein kinase domain-containing protein n=1 Tax=Apiospora saccharicola TaxID=335842 RepID=A0ABR1UM98_9PEZI
MAEVLGALASVLTITECISKAASLVIEYYKAPARIDDLQKQIKTFRDAVNAVENAPGVKDNFFLQSLASTSAIIEELDQLVTVEIVQKTTLSRRLRRSAWICCKPKISTLLQRLNHARSILGVALDVSQLNSRQDVVSKLATISQSTTSTEKTSISMERRMKNLERYVDAWEEDARHNNHRLTARSFASRTDGASSSLVRNFIGNEPGDTPPPTIITDLRCLTTAHETKKNHLFTGRGVIDDPITGDSSPASPFELSSSFFPELYTTMMAPHTLISQFLESVQETSYTRKSRCDVFYSPSPRKWLRITLSITISVDSPYWNLVYANNLDMKWGGDGWYLPTRLSPRDLSGACQPPKLQLEATESSTDIKKSLLEVTKMVRHWYCPRYHESDIVRRTLNRYSKHSGTAACIGSQWMLCLYFPANKEDFDTYLYNMQISHCLRNVPGIPRLLGVVYGQDDGHITWYLSEMATSPFLYHARKQRPRPRDIPWARREKKCWQVVSIVASLHNSGYLAGTLIDPIRDVFAVDSKDDLLCRPKFNTRFFYNENTLFAVPPECRSSAQLDSARRSLPASPSTDLYHLGLLVWRVANGLEVVLSSTLCGLAGCDTSPDKVCSEPHADPISLPSLHQDIPDYISQIVEICRSADPISREPAWKLLERFPSTTDRGWTGFKESPPHAVDVDT